MKEGRRDMERIVTYFMEQKQMTSVVAKVLAKKLVKYEDIKKEFYNWIITNSFECNDPVEVNGYTAQKVHDLAPQLDGSGVYSFLVTMRDKPEKAQEYINKGFPIK